eukprot:TRINITY_DN43154_c0_g1_i1.p1 TRINITY_DN43154_c0_g1~~TRINITY_DN43154_c0_g1_i1.p1  ORF type:complete len:729 (+),score=196.71 TRINITY_DN43154_c0_g1_i1:70-2256(+)
MAGLTLNANAVSGTYALEKRNNRTTDLLSPRSPGLKALRASDLSAAQGYYQRVKHTELEALNSIDPLLAKSSTDFGKRRAGNREPLRLPAIREAAPARPSPDASWRLSREQEGNAEEGMLPPSFRLGSNTDDFREWVKPRNMPATKMSEAEPSKSWNLLLLRATFDDVSLKVDDVASWLHQVLDMPLQDATQRAKAAKKRLLVPLIRCQTWKDAQEQVESLRSLGLAVQVVSETGVPMSTGRKRRAATDTSAEEAGEEVKAGTGGPAGNGKQSTPRSSAKRSGGQKSYKDLFREMTAQGNTTVRQREKPPALLSAFRFTSGRSVAGPEQGLLHRKQWRGASQSMEISVVPQDPVKDIFDREYGDKELTESQAAWSKAKARKEMLQKLVEDRKKSRITKKVDEDEPLLSRTVVDRRGRIRLNPEDMVKTLPSEMKISASRKEACQMMRFFVFGTVLTSDGMKPAADKDAKESLPPVYYEPRGTYDEVAALFNVWQKIDADGSGRCDVPEFRTYALERVEHQVKEKLLASDYTHGKKTSLPFWAVVRTNEDVSKVVNKFMKSAEKELLRSKGSFIIEDMMRLIWPAATIHDILEMHRWCIEMSKEFERKHVKTPPVLDKAELDALLSVFEYFDDDKSGELQIDELIATGLIKQHQAKKMIGEWDKDKSGSMDRWEFVQMLCPTGFRAFKEAKTGSLPDGTRLIFDDQKVCWRPVESDDEIDQDDDEDELQ